MLSQNALELFVPKLKWNREPFSFIAMVWALFTASFLLSVRVKVLKNVANLLCAVSNNVCVG